MKFREFAKFLETDPASLAALSTFNFDPDFFERRLLRCPALVKARRILVFMDAGQWANLLRQDARAGQLNRRYLVVPVRRNNGVFHPKLSLLVRPDGGSILCGSNNLTRAGCTSNLELLNALHITPEAEDVESVRLAHEAFAFFKRACDDAEEETGRIASRWLEELPRDIPWLMAELPPSENRSLRLVHTYDGSLWDKIQAVLSGEKPEQFLIISPFHDHDAALAKRILKTWPDCRLEVVVQQNTTCLPTSALKKLPSGIALSELHNSSRRLHAKLIAWRTADKTGCLVGSANFTTAAIDARNVETCLLLSGVQEELGKLFDENLDSRPLAIEDFYPGTENAPELENSDSHDLWLDSILLDEDGTIRVSYRHRFAVKPDHLRLAIRSMGEQQARLLLPVPNSERGMMSLSPPDGALKDLHGTILASLTAEIEGIRHESPPVWVIQEGRLTYEVSGERASTAKSRVEESGEGLAEMLEEIGKRDGLAAVTEYLKHLNIRFFDGDGQSGGNRKFRVRINDPFHSDEAPEWLIVSGEATGDLEQAVYDFVDRHEKHCLRRHASRGNLNGMANFLDVFSALIRLLYVYHQRGVVDRLQLIGRMCNYVSFATCGFETTRESSDGYLHRLHVNQDGDACVREECERINFIGNIRAAFMIVQRIRFVPGEEASSWSAPTRPRECLQTHDRRLRLGLKDLGLSEPAKADVMKALEEYKMFTPTELEEFEREMIS